MRPLYVQNFKSKSESFDFARKPGSCRENRLKLQYLNTEWPWARVISQLRWSQGLLSNDINSSSICDYHLGRLPRE